MVNDVKWGRFFILAYYVYSIDNMYQSSLLKLIENVAMQSLIFLGEDWTFDGSMWSKFVVLSRKICDYYKFMVMMLWNTSELTEREMDIKIIIVGYSLVYYG